MRTWNKRIVSMVICITLLLALLPSNTQASYDYGKKGSIGVQLNDLGTSLAGVGFQLYQVGTVTDSNNLEFELTPAFSGSKIDLNTLHYAADQEQAADKLADMVPANALASASSNASGALTFAGLDHGVYLICQSSTANYGKVEPYLVFLPMMNPTSDGWIYDVETSPKGETLSPPLEILKVDENNKPLAGASLELYDTEGNLLDNWVSTGAAHVITDIAKINSTYILKETKAPAGYLLAQEIEFTTGANAETVKVTMKDSKGSEEYQVKITKYVMQNDKYRSTSYTFYAALFWDAECTQRATEPVALEMNGGYSTTAVITLLTAGKFYVAETDADGNVIDTSSADAFFTNEIQNGTITLTPEQATASSTITNYIGDNPPDDFLQEDDAEIVINKKVIIDGKAGKVNETFYFTLFGEEELETVVAMGTLELNDASEGSVEFTELAYGTYYLAETDEDSVPVDAAFKYQVTVSEERVDLSADNNKTTVTITNELSNDPGTEPATQPTTKKTTTQVTTTKTTKTGTKTGDMSQAVTYLILLVAAAVVFGGIVIVKKKNEK